MICLILKHKTFIGQLGKFKNNRRKLLNLIRNSSSSEIKALGELSYNILRGNVYCSKHRKNKLKNYAGKLRILADKRKSLANKRKNLLKGNGIFLSSLIPLAIQTIASLLKK